MSLELEASVAMETLPDNKNYPEVQSEQTFYFAQNELSQELLVSHFSPNVSLRNFCFGLVAGLVFIWQVLETVHPIFLNAPTHWEDEDTASLFGLVFFGMATLTSIISMNVVLDNRHAAEDYKSVTVYGVTALYYLLDLLHSLPIVCLEEDKLTRCAIPARSLKWTLTTIAMILVMWQFQSLIIDKQDQLSVDFVLHVCTCDVFTMFGGFVFQTSNHWSRWIFFCASCLFAVPIFSMFGSLYISASRSQLPEGLKQISYLIPLLSFCTWSLFPFVVLINDAGHTSLDAVNCMFFILDVLAKGLLFLFLKIQHKSCYLYALMQASASIKAKMHHQRQFFMCATHELRNPLNSCSGYLELMSNDSSMSQETRDSLTVALNATSHLGHLIDDLLDLGAFAAGKTDIALHHVEFTLVDLMKKVSSFTRYRQVSLGVRFRVIIYGHHSSRLLGEELRISQILINLIDNAIKYSGAHQDKEVVCTVRFKGNTVDFIIKDCGMGMSKEQTKALFGEFTQFHSQQIAGGSGIGLHVSLKIARLLNGDITVRSKLGEGSVFVFSVPIHFVEMQQPLEEDPFVLEDDDKSSESSSSPTFTRQPSYKRAVSTSPDGCLTKRNRPNAEKKKRRKRHRRIAHEIEEFKKRFPFVKKMQVLICDDSTINCTVLKAQLQTFKFADITTVNSKDQCMAKLREGFCPALIFLDKYIGDSLGTDMVPEIRQLVPNCYIVQFTAERPSQSCVDLFEGILLKPVSLGTLMKVCRKVFTGAESSDFHPQMVTTPGKSKTG